MSEWRPIETAPKDAEVLVWDGARVWIAAHDGFGECWSSRSAFALDDRAGDDAGFYIADADEAGLTHWMPLPDPPN